VDEAYVEALRKRFPHLRLVEKGRSPFSRSIDTALRGVTFGGQRAFMTRYVTTIGQTIYLPSDWWDRSPTSRLITLRHEAVHLEQFRRLGFVPMAFLYLVPWLPLGLAWGRARLEWEAYRETLRATAELRGIEAAAHPKLVDHIVAQFTTSAYGWMWPFPKTVRGWIDAELTKLRAELG
jgi:hypothetical protein